MCKSSDAACSQLLCLLFLLLLLAHKMKQLSAEAKHAILLEYQPRSATHSFSALAARHSISGGSQTLEKWFQRWNGTVESLTRRSGSGRPRALTTTQVQRYIRQPVLQANRAHRAIHYPDLMPRLRQQTRQSVSLRTVQRYGRNELKIRDKKGIKRQASECE